MGRRAWNNLEGGWVIEEPDGSTSPLDDWNDVPSAVDSGAKVKWRGKKTHIQEGSARVKNWDRWAGTKGRSRVKNVRDFTDEEWEKYKESWLTYKESRLTNKKDTEEELAIKANMIGKTPGEESYCATCGCDLIVLPEHQTIYTFCSRKCAEEKLEVVKRDESSKSDSETESG